MCRRSYLCIVFLGAVLYGSAVTIPGVSTDGNCPLTDEEGFGLRSQSTPDAEGIEMECIYEGGADCLYLFGRVLHDGDDNSCPQGLVSDGGGDIMSKTTTSTTIRSPTATTPTSPATTTSRNISPTVTPTKSLTTTSTSISLAPSTATPTISSSTAPGTSPSASTGSTVITSLSASSTLTSSRLAANTVIVGQPPVSAPKARKSSLSGGKIGGIVVGTLMLLVLAIVLLLYIRRRRRRGRVDTEAFTEPEASSWAESIMATPARFITDGNVTLTREDTRATASSRTAGIRQGYLREKILAAQRVLEDLPSAVGRSPHSIYDSASGLPETEDGGRTLEQARHQNQVLQERIRTLESQLQSQWALGLSDEPPPGYLE
ncbi:hypothetical protein DFH09DRAFT_1162640 [Mycena vulgaris]|nr:hypothetical protein DFH09DRAFT_1162640 [Mycena vulgaris]